MKFKNLLIIALLAIAVASCGQTPKKQAEMQTCQGKKSEALEKQTENITINKNAVNELHIKYLEFEIDYYNDLNCLGLGVVNPKNYNFQVITDTITKTEFNIENIETQKYLIPVFWKPDYLIFYMPVIHISTKYYEVQVNSTMSVFVNKADFNFYTWETFLTNQTIAIDAEKGYSKPDIHSEVLYDSNDTSFDDISLIVEKVEGNWLLVKEEKDDNIINSCWVLWKSKNKMLIKPIFLM